MTFRRRQCRRRLVSSISVRGYLSRQSPALGSQHLPDPELFKEARRRSGNVRSSAGSPFNMGADLQQNSFDSKKLQGRDKNERAQIDETKRMVP